MKRIGVILLVLAGWMGSLNAQILPPEDGVFQLFESQVREGGVELTWMVYAGSECYDVEVQRSVNGSLFETIYINPGICGGEIRYSWTDPTPVPYVPNYYRLKSGANDVSKTIMFDYRFLEAEETALVYPHPVTDQANFAFKNHDLEPHQLQIFNLNGHHVATYESGFSNLIEISRNGLPAGQYIYLLRNDDYEIVTRGRIRFD